jgi:hypothetical protein
MFGVLTTISGMAIGGYATVKIVERKRRRDAINSLGRATALEHRAYSRCMHDIINFDESTENASDVFRTEMKNSNRSETVRRVRDCIPVVKDFWYLVMAYDEAFGVFNADSIKKELYRGMYARFVPVVGKYDKLAGYEETDPVFEIKSLANVHHTDEAKKE